MARGGHRDREVAAAGERDLGVAAQPARRACRPSPGRQLSARPSTRCTFPDSAAPDVNVL
jgi:hypothetical protein